MIYINHYAKFMAAYDECYNDIIKMFKNKGIVHLECVEDEGYGYDGITIENPFYGNVEDYYVTEVGIEGDDLYFCDERRNSYDVKRWVEGASITDLYDIVYRALYENNN